MKNIALIGFMGSGKTTLAGILAEKLGFNLCELDNDILATVGYSTINEIFDNHGEKHFREIEKKTIAKNVRKTNQVISCGGGVVSSIEAMELLKNSAIVIFLHADFSTITERLKNTDSRPLFRDREKAMALYAQRLPLYKKYADIQIKTDDSTPDEIVEMITKRLMSISK